MTAFLSNRYLRILPPVILLTSLIYAPIIKAMTVVAYDYVVHMQLAVVMMKIRAIIVPHFLFHVSVISAALFSPEAVPKATLFILLFAVLATAITVALILNKEWPNPVMAIFMTVSLLIATPVAILAPFDQHLYFGYISPNVFHNPTILVLKPLALISFGLIIKAFDSKNKNSRLDLIACIFATIACALAKPSFTICILPAALLLLIYRLLRKDSSDMKLLLFGLAIPALVTLALQFSITYSADQLPSIYEGKSGIIFAPLVVMSSQSSWLLPKLLLSLIFPLAVLLSNLRSTLKDTQLQLAWLAFLIATAYLYLLAESGPRMFQGNFGWSGQVTLFILYVYSARFLLHSRFQPSGPAPMITGKKYYLCNAALLLHTAFGILFYFSELFQPELYW